MGLIKYKSIIDNKDVKHKVENPDSFCIDLAYVCQDLCDKANAEKTRFSNEDTFEVQGVKMYCLDFICRQVEGYAFMGYYPEAS